MEIEKVRVVFVLLLSLGVLSCCLTADRVDIEIENRTPHTLVITAGLGLFSTEIRLGPGEKTTRWVDPRFVARRVRVVVD